MINRAGREKSNPWFRIVKYEHVHQHTGFRIFTLDNHKEQLYFPNFRNWDLFSDQNQRDALNCSLKNIVPEKSATPFFFIGICNSNNSTDVMFLLYMMPHQVFNNTHTHTHMNHRAGTNLNIVGTIILVTTSLE